MRDRPIDRCLPNTGQHEGRKGKDMHPSPVWIRTHDPSFKLILRTLCDEVTLLKHNFKA
jgi:hypothetical protein